MRRFVWPGVGLLLTGIVALRTAAQQPPAQPPVATLEEPRANPVLPAVLVPFTIAPELCRQGHTPRVDLRVYNSLTQPVAFLRLRERNSVVLDNVPLKCGDHVGLWDGTVENGTRAVSPGLYRVRLSVDGTGFAKILIITPP
jgi:hypothetical protein